MRDLQSIKDVVKVSCKANAGKGGDRSEKKQKGEGSSSKILSILHYVCSGTDILCGISIRTFDHVTCNFGREV